ncbi:MAG: hypothetical protein ACK524_25180, partial [Planctomyces sp.]
GDTSLFKPGQHKACRLATIGEYVVRFFAQHFCRAIDGRDQFVGFVVRCTVSNPALIDRVKDAVLFCLGFQILRAETAAAGTFAKTLGVNLAGCSSRDPSKLHGG